MAKKRATRKKTSKKSMVLKKTPVHYSFVIVNGKKIKSLPELALEMDSIADDIFAHHVNEARNDFASWIRDVIGEIELADHLMGIKTKEDMQLQILKHIVKSIK